MIIGIDLGTTNSLIGFFDSEINLLKNDFDSYLTPSIIGINDDDEIIVGEAAKPLLYDGKAVKLFKRNMGESKKIKLGTKSYSAMELSSILINHLIKIYTDNYNDEIEGLVISVPAYFNENQRYATKLAGELTGYPVIRIINEPTAAALYAKEILDYDKFSSNYIVIDLGGGTLDLTVVEYFEKIFEIKAISGDVNLGGEDYTNILVEMFNEKFPGLNQFKVYAACERAKFNLNSGYDSSTEISVGENTLTVSFDDFYFRCTELNNKIGLLIHKVLTDSSINVDEIDHIIFVGGGAKALAFRKYIYDAFNSDMSNETFFLDDDSELYVAYGVVLYSTIINDESEYIITDVCPFSLGVDVVSNTDLQKKRTSHIINRNSILPISTYKSFTTLSANQKEVRFGIYQGENYDPNKNLFLGEIRCSASGTEHNSFRVTFTYDINSILEVKVLNINTNEEKTQVIHHNLELSDKELANLKNAFKKQKTKLTQRDKSEYYLNLLQFNFENCHVSQREYYAYLIERYMFLKQEKQSMIELVKFEKELDNILNGGNENGFLF